MSSSRQILNMTSNETSWRRMASHLKRQLKRSSPIKGDRDRYQLYGRAVGGRALKIIFQLKAGGIVRIITGWPL